MTIPPSSRPEDASTAATMVKPKDKARPKLDPRYIAPLLISCVLIAADQAGVLESPWKTALAIVTAMVTEMILGYLTTRKLPHLASAYVTGISVGILVRSPWFWPYAACAAISISSKYVLRWKGKHLWNPSNFGITWMLFVASQTVAPLSIQFGNDLAPMVIIWILGSFIISRLKRFHICATYVISFLAFAALRSVITGDPVASEIAPITGPPYQLFTLFMITDPKTTVKSYKGQILVAFCVAMVECIFRLCHNVHAPYWGLFIVGPIANLIEMRLNPPKPGSSAASKHLRRDNLRAAEETRKSGN